MQVISHGCSELVSTMVPSCPETGFQSIVPHLPSGLSPFCTLSLLQFPESRGFDKNVSLGQSANFTLS